MHCRNSSYSMCGHLFSAATCEEAFVQQRIYQGSVLRNWLMKPTVQRDMDLIVKDLRELASDNRRDKQRKDKKGVAAATKHLTKKQKQQQQKQEAAAALTNNTKGGKNKGKKGKRGRKRSK